MQLDVTLAGSGVQLDAPEDGATALLDALLADSGVQFEEEHLAPALLRTQPAISTHTPPMCSGTWSLSPCGCRGRRCPRGWRRRRGPSWKHWR